MEQQAASTLDNVQGTIGSSPLLPQTLPPPPHIEKPKVIRCGVPTEPDFQTKIDSLGGALSLVGIGAQVHKHARSPPLQDVPTEQLSKKSLKEALEHQKNQINDLYMQLFIQAEANKKLIERLDAIQSVIGPLPSIQQGSSHVALPATPCPSTVTSTGSATTTVRSPRSVPVSSPHHTPRDHFGLVDDTDADSGLKKPKTELDILEDQLGNHIFHRGFVLKEGRVVKNWKLRWFILRGTRLVYYKRREDTTPQGEIHLSSCALNHVYHNDKDCMELLMDGRKLYFVAETQDETVHWAVALDTALAYATYLKKCKLQNTKPSAVILRFFLNPHTQYLSFDPLSTDLSAVESMVALTQPLKFNTHLRTLILTGALSHQFGDFFCDLLGPALSRNKGVQRVNVSMNHITGAGCAKLAEGLRDNTTLTELNLDRNPLGDPGAKALASVLTQHPYLTTVTLSDTRISDTGAQALFTAIADRHQSKSGHKAMMAISTIRMSMNQISHSGAVALASLLDRDPDITDIDLSGNQISDYGAQAIATALGHSHCGVTALDLTGNPLSRVAESNLVRLLEPNTRICKLSFGSVRLDQGGVSALRALFQLGYVKPPSMVAMPCPSQANASDETEKSTCTPASE